MVTADVCNYRTQLCRLSKIRRRINNTNIIPRDPVIGGRVTTALGRTAPNGGVVRGYPARGSTPCGRLDASVPLLGYGGCGLPGAIEPLRHLANERLLARDDDPEAIRRIERIGDVDTRLHLVDHVVGDRNIGPDADR